MSKNRFIISLAMGMLAVVVSLGCNQAQAAYTLYTDEAAFLADTSATDPTNGLSPISPSGQSEKFYEPLFFSNGLMFVNEWTYSSPGNEIAITGGENFDIGFKTALDERGGINSLGFSIVETTLTGNAGCGRGTLCTDSKFEISYYGGYDGDQLITTFEVDPYIADQSIPEEQIHFAGIYSDDLITKVEIREVEGGTDNEFFGNFYLSGFQLVSQDDQTGGDDGDDGDGDDQSGSGGDDPSGSALPFDGGAGLMLLGAACALARRLR